MIIEIKGVQFVNKGAELMLHAVLQKMQQFWPDAELVLAPNPNSPYVSRARLGAYQKLSLRKSIIDLNQLTYWLPKRLRNRLKKVFGLVTEADIDIIFDASGFAYGDQWKPALIKALAAELNRAARNGKKYILLPQALGPFTREKDIGLLKRSLPLATLIFSREETSYSNVRKLIGDSPNLVQYPDFTNLVTGTVPDYYSDGERKVLIIPNSNMLSHRNQHGQWQNTYIRVLTDAVDVIRAQGLLPVLLNHEGSADGDICKQIAELAGGDIEQINESDPLKVKGIIGASKAVICSRFHGCVSALSQGVPCIGTSWSHKYERLYEEYSQQDCLIAPDITKAGLTQVLNDAIVNISLPQRVAARKKFKIQAEQMWKLVAEAVAS